jgi:hypothetical protein
LRELKPVDDVVGAVVGLVAMFALLIWPWVAAASVGGFDEETWQTVGRSKPAWFLAVLLIPLAAIVYWLLVRPELRRATAGLKPAGAPSADGPAPE